MLELLKLVWILGYKAQLVLKVARWGHKTTPVNIFLNYVLVHECVARRAESWIRLQNNLDQIEKRLRIKAISGKTFGARIISSYDSLIKFLHIVGSERRSEGNHLV